MSVSQSIGRTTSFLVYERPYSRIRTATTDLGVFREPAHPLAATGSCLPLTAAYSSGPAGTSNRPLASCCVIASERAVKPRRSANNTPTSVVMPPGGANSTRVAHRLGSFATVDSQAVEPVGRQRLQMVHRTCRSEDLRLGRALLGQAARHHPLPAGQSRVRRILPHSSRMAHRRAQRSAIADDCGVDQFGQFVRQGCASQRLAVQRVHPRRERDTRNQPNPL
jgi:hypothetical protein